MPTKFLRTEHCPIYCWKGDFRFREHEISEFEIGRIDILAKLIAIHSQNCSQARSLSNQANDGNITIEGHLI